MWSLPGAFDVGTPGTMEAAAKVGACRRAKLRSRHQACTLQQAASNSLPHHVPAGQVSRSKRLWTLALCLVSEGLDPQQRRALPMNSRLYLLGSFRMGDLARSAGEQRTLHARIEVSGLCEASRGGRRPTLTPTLPTVSASRLRPTSTKHKLRYPAHTNAPAPATRGRVLANGLL